MKAYQKIKAVLKDAGAFDVRECEIIRMDEVEAAQHGINMAAAPAFLAFWLGIGGLLFPNFFPIAFAAVEEFMQLVGIKMAVYLALLLGGLAVIFSVLRYSWLARRIAWLTSSLSFVGFNLSATAFGIALGLSIPAAIEQRSFSYFGLYLFLSTIFVLLQALFFCLAHVVEGRYVEPRNKLLGKNAAVWGSIIGLAVVAIAVWSGLHEKWPEPQEEECPPTAEAK